MSDQAAEVSPDGPTVATYTFPLPFTLGLDMSYYTKALLIPEGTAETIGNSLWVAPAASEVFGEVPTVTMRFHKIGTDGISTMPQHATAALKAFYGADTDYETIQVPRWGAGDSYQQWVTLETPNSRLSWESPDDPAVTFHRSLAQFNDFLTGYIVALAEPFVHPITTLDLGSVVFRGAIDRDGMWHDLGVLFMHIETLPTFVQPLDIEKVAPLLDLAWTAVRGGQPLIPAKLWYWRALSAERRGDSADRVSSLQTSMESLLYGIYRLTLVDQGVSAGEIDHLVQDQLFKPLVATKLPPLLGGRWDLTAQHSELGAYWAELYELRNRVVHSGYDPSIPEADAATTAYLALRSFLDVRIWAKRRELPRTALAKLGYPARGGRVDSSFSAAAQAIMGSDPFWWLPHDLRRPTV
jgi:hypothetical protein